jgi:hypothetical protein
MSADKPFISLADEIRALAELRAGQAAAAAVPGSSPAADPPAEKPVEQNLGQQWVAHGVKTAADRAAAAGDPRWDLSQPLGLRKVVKPTD